MNEIKSRIENAGYRLVTLSNHGSLKLREVKIEKNGVTKSLLGSMISPVYFKESRVWLTVKDVIKIAYDYDDDELLEAIWRIPKAKLDEVINQANQLGIVYNKWLGHISDTQIDYDVSDQFEWTDVSSNCSVGIKGDTAKYITCYYAESCIDVFEFDHVPTVEEVVKAKALDDEIERIKRGYYYE